MANSSAFTSGMSPKVPNRPAPPPPKINKPPTQSRLAKVLSLKSSKSLNGCQQSVKKKPPPRPPPPKIMQLPKSQGKTGLTSLMSLKSKYTITTPSWVGKSNEMKYTTTTVEGVLIDLNSPQTSPTSTHKSSSDGNSVDSFNSDFGPWRDSQAESSGFEDDFDLLCSKRDLDCFKNCTQLNTTNSLPPPSLPPPMLPPDALNVLLNGPKLPPRPNEMQIQSSKSLGTCVAQFDYKSDHSDDLVFKEGDQISITRYVNDEWLEGTLDGRTGMFPISYVEITSPLSKESLSNQTYCKVIAVFTFHPECWEDLSIQEGDEIQVLRKINEDWFYGECNGSRGQFPSNFVTELPDDL